MSFRILSIAEVVRLTGLSRRTVYSEISEGDFPGQCSSR